MALIKCNECGKEISDKATTCPNCGCPINEEKKETINEISDKGKKNEKKHIFAWIICILTFLSAINSISYFGAFICYILAGVLVCPKFIKYMKKVKNKEIKKWIQVIVWLILITVAAGCLPANETEVEETNSEIIENTISNENEVSTIPEETPEEKAQRELNEKNNFIATCENFAYKDIARNPSNYIGKNLKFKGEVQQASESKGLFSDTTSVTLLIAVTESEYGFYDDNIYCTYTYSEGESKILEDDIVTIYGVCEGDYSYTSVLGASITVPKLDLKYYEIHE